MVQLKYFGDSRDYFKYDLITNVLSSGLVSNYSFVPMLTNHRDDGEGNKTPNHIEGKSIELLSFIDNCQSKDLEHWQLWFKPYIESYITVQPVNSTFFDDSARNKYWRSFKEVIASENALVFVDPDTGLETGSPSYLKKMGREKYILNGEFRYLYSMLNSSSILMVYQHLPNNKHKHEEAVLKKINQASKTTGKSLVIAYREDDLAFLFMAKDETVFLALREILVKYHQASGHTYKSIHYAPKNV